MVSRFPCLSYLAFRSSIPVRPRLNFAGKVAKLLYSALCAASFGAIMPSKGRFHAPGFDEAEPDTEIRELGAAGFDKGFQRPLRSRTGAKNPAAIHPIRLQA